MDSTKAFKILEVVGFHTADTGGGCSALELHDDNGSYLCITDGECDIPQDFTTEIWIGDMSEDHGDPIKQRSYKAEEFEAILAKMDSINDQCLKKYGEGLEYEQVRVFLGLGEENELEGMLQDMRDRMGLSHD